MHFMIQLLNSLDELIFRVMSWLLFYPLTLWRTLRSPAAMMAYAERELTDTDDKRYGDAISPPLFLFLSVLVSHGIELALLGDSPLIANHHGLAAVVDDDSSLLMLRVMFFGLFPLVMALILLRRRGIKLMQQSLKGPFYAQCYVAAPYALAVSLSSSLLQTHNDWVLFAGLVLLAIALIWYVAVQALSFARELKITALRPGDGDPWHGRGAGDLHRGWRLSQIGRGPSPSTAPPTKEGREHRPRPSRRVHGRRRR